MPNNQWSNPPVDTPHDVRPVERAQATAAQPTRPLPVTIDLMPNGQGIVRVGGVDIGPAVTGLTVTSHGGGRGTTATLDLRVELHAAVDHSRIAIPDHTHAALLELGWTPPGSEASR